MILPSTQKGPSIKRALFVCVELVAGGQITLTWADHSARKGAGCEISPSRTDRAENPL